ncbi:hypothetical protein E1B28_004270 [Marasmius oreades]|uniref:RRN7-type domain-containing protein n=1 Tax=Marasmius oreades TaxID=181124 RepID=A0A9P7UYB2_9AGAR|nr:uncharacterized protein E1B28_004270 [Marasmius oreades]KAG7096862.1 hypothetical protein E1B28_004270 [Marasmius oreades]
MAPRRRCPICRSKQWHKEPLSGLIACSEGHILQNYRNETNEAEDMGTHVLQKRTLKSDRKQKGKESRANPKLYHGARGRYLYFQCQQLILRKQVVALLQLRNLPVEFEAVCRDIWALHLSLLPDPPSAEPYFHGSQQQKGSSPEAAGPSSEGEEGQGDPESVSSSSEENEDDQFNDSAGQSDQEDPVIAELLRQNSETESDDEDRNDDRKQGHQVLAGRKKRHVIYERPANNLAVLVVACWTLRIPILYRDLLRYIELYELPYLDPIRLLPDSLVSHLTKHRIRALSPAHAPNIISLHSLTSRLSRLMLSCFGISTPEANAAHILWRVVLSLGGTPPLYSLTKKLSSILSLPLTLHHSLVPGLMKAKTRDPESHKFDDVPVEVSFVAATIVVLKLVYGLDGNPRSPRDPDDPACILPKVEEYLEAVKKLNEDDLQEEAIFDYEKGKSVGEMSEEEIDRYFSFCEHALLAPNVDRDGDKFLASYFPLTFEERQQQSLSLGTAEKREERQRLSATQIASEDDTRIRPGQSYVIYHARDSLGMMSEEMEIVTTRGARWVGVSEDLLCGVVERYERRLVRWWKNRNSGRVEAT